MLKKLILIVVCLCLGFSFGAQIPKEKQAQYKKEIERTIDIYFSAIEQMDETAFEAKKIYESYNREPNKEKYKQTYIRILEKLQRDINISEFHFYIELIEVTKKYVDIEQEIPETGFSALLYEFIMPHLKNNNIDIKKVDKIYSYSIEKTQEIQTYIDRL